MANKITNFKTQVKEIRNIQADITEALKAVADKYDITIALGNGSYDANLVSFKVNCTTKGENGEVETLEAKDFKRYALMYGLKPEFLGKEFKHGRDTFRITGFKPRSKNSVIASKVGTTQSYKFSPELVKQLIGA